MNIYGGFAGVYDLFMADAPYDLWADYVTDIFERYGKSPELLLELGCGTGNITTRLAKKGYDVIGLDNSAEMLQIAKQKDSSILYLQQDMRGFELYGTVDAIICLCDGLNYILDDGGLASVFSLVKNYLNPGGIFIFDINTVYKFEHILADNTFAENNEGAAYIWENCYYADERINEYAVAFFVENERGLYEKIEETHQQRAYSVAELETAIRTAGLTIAGIFDECSFDKPTKTSERIYFVATK